MTVAAFLTAALESALDNEMATPDDVLRHATPDLLAAHVPRPVWVRLLTTCLAAPRVDARLVVETIGVATLCQHVPAATMWTCLAEIATRALGRGLVAAPPSVIASASAPIIPSPAAARVATPPSGTQLDRTGRAVTVTGATGDGGATGGGASGAVASVTGASTATVTPTGNPRAATSPVVPLMAKGTDPAAEITRVAHPPPELSKIAAEKSETRGELTRVAAAPREPEPLGEPPKPPRGPGATTRASAATQPPVSGRRPQASAPAKTARGSQPSPRRVSTATDFEIETDVNEQWKRAGASGPAIEVPVEDDQLIDWSTSEETATSGDKYGDRKR